MSDKYPISSQTRRNWTIDAFLCGALAAELSDL